MLTSLPVNAPLGCVSRTGRFLFWGGGGGGGGVRPVSRTNRQQCRWPANADERYHWRSLPQSESWSCPSRFCRLQILHLQLNSDILNFTASRMRGNIAATKLALFSSSFFPPPPPFFFFFFPPLFFLEGQLLQQ